MSENRDLRERFIQKLEDKYGHWNRTTSRFGNSSFGEISNALSISPSQFTKLISGTATDGMYLRSLENIDRLIKRDTIKQSLEKALENNEQLKAALKHHRKKQTNSILISVLMAFLAGLLAFSVFSTIQKSPAGNSKLLDGHPLSVFFENPLVDEFKSPYLDINEVQSFCPCSAYEGEWSLASTYKLPLPGSKKPGLYYTAKSADVRMKCSRTETLSPGKGRVLLGYEYLINEIWIDTTRTPLSPTYFDKSKKVFTSEFDNLVFEENHNFQKLATINSFFIDRFEIHDDYILRTGEPCGRYASEINAELAEAYNIDIEYILKRILSNLTTTACEKAINPYCDPNQLDAGSVISFECLYTIETENLGIGGGYPYEKGYKLDKQIYADNLTCECNALQSQYETGDSD